MKSTLRFASLVGLVVLLSACGFALRGTQQAPLAVDTVVLRGDVSSLLTRQLSDALESMGVTTVIAQSANYVLTVGPEQFNSRMLSVNGRAQAAQYELQMAVEVVLERGDVLLLPPEVISVERSYFEDTANIAGSNAEMELLQTEMRRELVDTLVRRLAAAAG